ncbi:MAG: class I SAM-dependent RNA methyltransferase [Rubrimonas sp.]|uniref:class I SAM-dependent RNA methyltransferase n=1 Tax=Rubrimonas sp. TaxID=2036015 RepID=UPI002FDD9C15
MAEIEIIALGHRGDGEAAGEGGALYAPFTLPGERVAGEIAGDRIARPAVLRTAPARIAPVCPHFGACGGCALQHASDAFLAEWKTELVRTALAARGLEAELRPIHVSPPGARRRVVLSGRRLKSGVLLGFHGRGEAEIVGVDACPVAHPEILGARAALARIVGLIGSRKGEVKLSVAVSEAGLDVAAEGGKPLDASLRAALGALAEEADFARLSLGGETLAGRRPPFQRFGRALVAPPPGGFIQATADGEAALVAAAREAVGDAKRVADLFAGAGALALPLAERAAVTAVEADAAALAALDAGWRRAEGLRAVRCEARDLFRRPLAAAELDAFDAVAIDPPRAGAQAQTAQIAASRLRAVAALSCNPATFARDARILVDAGFRLLWIQPVDQFRWSPHVELAAAFAR